MNQQAIEQIANAVLYEGYMLYPYRASSIKNRHRFNFGVLYPEGFDTSSQRTECLVRDDGEAMLDITIRYLRLDKDQQAHEREIVIPDMLLQELAKAPREETFEPGAVRISVDPAARGCYRLAIEISNTARMSSETPREDALRESLISLHTILTVRGGSFPSMLDPPEELREAAAQCHNNGTWPVLAGEEGSHDAMLSSPIILYDYPQVAPESAGNLFDGTEIDEILSLRILTLTDEEKAEIREGDERARQILERTENIPAEQFLKLHGALRKPGAALKAGDRVRLRPRRSADIMDIALDGKLATIDAVEEDFEGNIHLAVVIDDDPGRDFGILRQPGHRFFFGPEEVTRVQE
ncbi:MAG TPA: hypothetical protein VG297_16645 [Bryobacteraceae bacterium]|jgi:hypothetical protein|nr:hypothetical protein [Bryobacteraceae bacterium]